MNNGEYLDTNGMHHLMLDYKADPLYRMSSFMQNEVVHYCCVFGRLKDLQWFSARYNLDIHDKYKIVGGNVLNIAVLMNQYEISSYLLSKRISATLKLFGLYTPEAWARKFQRE